LGLTVHPKVQKKLENADLDQIELDWRASRARHRATHPKKEGAGDEIDGLHKNQWCSPHVMNMVPQNRGGNKRILPEVRKSKTEETQANILLLGKEIQGRADVPSYSLERRIL